MGSIKKFLHRIRWLRKIKDNPGLIKSVPEKLKTKAICLAAVKENGIMLKYVPKPLKTKKICLAAIRESGRALEYVPEPLKSEVLCHIAVKDRIRAFKYVPDNLKVQQIPIYIINLTDDEIDIINIWAMDIINSNNGKIIEIDETIYKEGKIYFIDKSAQSRLKNIRCVTDAYYDIDRIEFSENNTKAILSFAEGVGYFGPLSGTGGEVYFSKENNIWKKTGVETRWMS